MIYENTIKKEITITGIGIHSGKEVALKCFPSNKRGIIFEYENNSESSLLVTAKNCHSEHNRATCLKNNSMSILTPEHFYLPALH